ncbi:MAG: hypothetical protein A3B31_01530 [Candidatus Komeilibacteria bacterium RIFCSPLOWO2_01_FULL_53_11]|uniref:DUF488 domain-containing protein n=1 Tax=Candidatus Komeilibacteria bacterium RIFCSPLOWO2_01_FULL_53_11 TaxID=1798552 RepID=A0A1G2BV09_9BACT|nr:MAG: hypothetical protein A3B31_01530 [Candidatus Komeilibacteria bacterium RIFCSPLOWO2_01_FULL_53_11]
MFKTKSVAEPLESHDGKRVLISAYWPLGPENYRFDIWLRELGSELEHVKNWPSHRFDQKKFITQYKRQLKKKALQPILEKLAEEGRYNTVTLLCHCKKDADCHRLILKKYLERL